MPSSKTAKRVASIVLSATDKLDLSQAIDEATDCKEYTDNLSIPLPIREALLEYCHYLVARSVLDMVDSFGLDVPAWIDVELQKFSVAGPEFLLKFLGSLTDERLRSILAEYYTQKAHMAEWERKSAESGKDVFWPYGEPEEVSTDDWQKVPEYPIPVALEGLRDADWHLEPDEEKL